MACIDKIYSVSALVGKGTCNANCSFCAGKYLRSEAIYSQSALNLNYYKNLEAALKLCARYGGWSFSITSSGEPTCEPDAVTQALNVYKKCESEGAYFPNVNLFTNGILLGDLNFCKHWLPKWKEKGLTNIAVSIHSVDKDKQAAAYGIKEYPYFQNIFDNIKRFGLGVRCTLLLRKGEVDNAKKYQEAIEYLDAVGCNNITSWSVGNPDGSRNQFTPSRLGLWSIKFWLFRNTKLCHGHSWGGGVYDWNGNILRLTDYVTKHNPNKNFVRQLVVFNSGLVTYSWIKEGALCMK